MIVEEEKNNSNETSISKNNLTENKDDINNEISLSTSTNNLNEKVDDIHNENENNIQKEKDEKITIEDLEKIITESDDQEKEKETIKEQKNVKIIGKKDSNSSHDEILESELTMIKKQNIKRYLMVKKQFKSTLNESEEETYQNNKSVKPKKCKLYKFVGRTLFLFLDRYENPLIIIGPHWPMSVCFCGIISLIMLTIYLTLWKQIGMIMRILGHICFWTYFISYAHCSLYNPGYPKNDNGRKFGYPRNDYSFCSACQFFVKKNKYVTHCLDCDICIENQDHHCPWTGHCIGKNNYYSFMIFIGSSFFIIIYLAAAISIGASSYN